MRRGFQRFDWRVQCTSVDLTFFSLERGHCEAIKRVDRVFQKLQTNVASWDALNVKRSRFKFWNSRFALCFKYEWGIQLSLLDNLHGQEK